MKHIVFVLVLFLLSCSEKKEETDLIIINANIYTVDDEFSTATALTVKAGKFQEIGSSDAILAKYSSSQTINADGQTIVPGLIDAHCHFYQLGLGEQIADLIGTTSFEEVMNRVEKFYGGATPSVIRGRGWDQNDWEVKEYPTKALLDEKYPDIPVVLERVDGHAYLVNQKVLDMAGIDGATDETGGKIVKENGVPTGILIDSPMYLVDAIMPQPDLNTQIEALKDAQQICFNNGLTTVNDAGLNPDVISLIDSLQQAGDLSIRVYAMISNSPQNLDYYLAQGPIKTEKLNVRSVKVYADGALGSRGATLKEEYSDFPGHFGAMVTPADEIEALAARLAASEFQMNTHAIGDSANSVVMKAYKTALSGQADRRWKIEHAQVIDPTEFDYFADGIIPSVQPTHTTSDMYWAEDRLGEERMHGAYAYRTLLSKASRLALGTDFPVEAVSPFYTFYAAVARKDLEQYPEGGFNAEEALSREDALRGMTIWAAYSNFEEDEKGSIEIGKLADFVILDRDIMTVPEDEIPDISAEHVYINGRIAE